MTNDRVRVEDIFALALTVNFTPDDKIHVNFRALEDVEDLQDGFDHFAILSFPQKVSFVCSTKDVFGTESDVLRWVSFECDAHSTQNMV